MKNPLRPFDKNCCPKPLFDALTKIRGSSFLDMLSPPSLPPTDRESAVRAAIEALLTNDAERRCLYSCARWRIMPILETVRHSDAEDLVNEAIERTLSGQREWNEAEKTMLQFLLGVVSSVANEWYKRMKRQSELSDTHPSPDEVQTPTLRKIALDRVRQGLNGDATAIAVFESLLNGEKPSEATQVLNISMQIYEAARRRVIRHGREILSSDREAKV